MNHSWRTRTRSAALALLLGLGGCVGVTPPAAPPDPAGAPLPEPPAPTRADERRAPSPADGMPSAGLDAPPAEDGGLPVHGTLNLRYRGRRTDDADDHDLYATLSLNVGDSERHPFTAHVMGRIDGDLGGDDPNDVFGGLDDTFGGSLNEILYYGYVDAHDVDALERLRIGRQQLWDAPAFVVFDGALVELDELQGIQLGAYGGRRTQYYDPSSPNDVVAGAYGEARPWPGGRVRLDYMYLEDEDRLGSAQGELVGLDVWQTVGEELTLEAEYTRLDGDDRDLRLRAHWLDEDWSFQATYYNQLETQGREAFEVDPYFASLQEYFAFHELGLLASKSFGEVVDLSLGVDLRWLEDDSDVGEFNHEFEHYTLSAMFPDLAVDGLDVTVSGDVWEDDQQDVRTWGLDLTQEIDPKLEASLGSYYSLYKYDLFLNDERDDVRTYYAGLHYDRSAALSFDLDFEYEDDDFEEYQTLRLGARWRF